jgi:L-erythro-3,5-diaminohexanoate dehydrogenase
VAEGWSVDADRLGVHRSLDPPGALPHIARVLDANGGPNDFEAELDVETLAVDATSFAAIRERSDGDPGRMAATIATIVAEHGKLQNPWTDSGGVLLGRVVRVGDRHVTPDLVPGEMVVPLASLIAIPLTLQSVGPVDPARPHVPVRGRAIVTGSMLCSRLPSDLAPDLALTALDVYPVASHVRALAGAGSHVLVLGAGHAGLLGVAASREIGGRGATVTAVDRDAAALARARAVDPAVRTLLADVTDPLAVARGLVEEGVPRADLTLLCASVAGAEGAAILATAHRGTVLFFSTATRFSAAALGADAVGAQPHLVIPNGLTDDRGQYAFELLGSNPALRDAFGGARW